MDDVRSAEASQRASGDVRELRLAVVCYGGSSLAIYMHGVTKEIQKLAVASAAFERDPTRHPFEQNDTARVYWELLARRRFGTTEAAGGEDGPSSREPVAPRTRVVVDIVSGTSAGGINGICLAKALARNRSQDALRDTWLNEGDIRKLLRGPSWLPAGLRFVGIVASSLARLWKVQPPFRGDRMCQLLHTTFANMDADRPLLRDPDPGTLVPPGHTLSLYVPVTDFHGYDREIPLDDPRVVRDRTHRHEIALRHDPDAGIDQASHFAPRFNHGLAFTARATSSIPGVFPPISFARYAAAFEGRRRRGSDAPDAGRPNLPDLVGDLFKEYQESDGAAADRTYFIDGGQLDNFPFRSAIQAIASRPASTEVDRRLLFVEPDPADGAGIPQDTSPTWHGAIWGGFVAIPSKEPVLNDFQWLAGRNRTVRRVRDIIETNFEEVSVEVARLVEGEPGSLPEMSDGTELVSRFELMEQQAAERAGFAYGSYLRVRIRDVVDRYAALVSSLRGFSDGSYQATFVSSVLRAWAERDGLLEQSTRGTEQQRTFLAQHDLAYTERRIHFLIAAINWWYGTVGKPGYPTRAQLDRAKQRLYERVGELRAIERDAAADPALVAPLQLLFDGAAVRQAVLEDQEDAATFVERHREVLVELRDTLGKRVETAVPAVMERLHGDLRQMGAEWTPEIANALRTRYLGFAFWDVLVYPLEALSGVCERDHVEAVRMGPADVSLLAEKKGQKKAKKTRLFGLPFLSRKDPADEQKLYGVSLHHFGAFFSRRGREQDYLWGRLDAAERLITLLLDDPENPGLRPPDPAACRPAFEAILADEVHLEHAEDLLQDLRQRVADLPAEGDQPAA